MTMILLQEVYQGISLYAREQLQIEGLEGSFIKYSDEELINAYRQLDERKHALEKKIADYAGEPQTHKLDLEMAQLRNEIKTYTVACQYIVDAGIQMQESTD